MTPPLTAADIARRAAANLRAWGYTDPAQIERAVALNVYCDEGWTRTCPTPCDDCLDRAKEALK